MIAPLWLSILFKCFKSHWTNSMGSCSKRTLIITAEIHTPSRTRGRLRKQRAYHRIHQSCQASRHHHPSQHRMKRMRNSMKWSVCRSSKPFEPLSGSLTQLGRKEKQPSTWLKLSSKRFLSLSEVKDHMDQLSLLVWNSMDHKLASLPLILAMWTLLWRVLNSAATSTLRSERCANSTLP